MTRLKIPGKNGGQTYGCICRNAGRRQSHRRSAKPVLHDCNYSEGEPERPEKTEDFQIAEETETLFFVFGVIGPSCGARAWPQALVAHRSPVRASEILLNRA